MGKARKRKMERRLNLVGDPRPVQPERPKPARTWIDLWSERCILPFTDKQLPALRNIRAGMPPQERSVLWPDELFIPSHVWFIVGAHRNGAKGEGGIVAALEHNDANSDRISVGMAAWRTGKTIYRVDGTLCKALMETSASGAMPVEVLRRLPQYGTYFESSLEEHHLGEVDGMPAFPRTVGALAYLDMVDLPVDSTGPTLSLVFSLVIDHRDPSLMAQVFAEYAAQGSALTVPLISGRTIDECIELGTGGGGTGRHARPHVRQAHWHGYWHGKREGVSREFRMHWVAPVLVNATGAEDLVATVRAA
jgi:hypothetical protein